MNDPLTDLLSIAREFSQRPDLIQGAGGNLSVKIDDRRMLIKASGLTFDQLSAERGIVTVDYAKLREHYHNASVSDDHQAAEFLLSCRLDNESTERPSMEAGFHALLGRYVLHTHSVYANVLNCARGGGQLAVELCHQLDIPTAYLSYYHPGEELAAAIAQLISLSPTPPSVIFLGNHGLVVSGETAADVLSLHHLVNSAIQQAYQLMPYPATSVAPSEGSFAPSHQPMIDLDQLRQLVLFPDQAVFLSDLVDKLRIDPSGQISYHTTEDEARTLDQLITAWDYIRHSIIQLGLTPLTLDPTAVKHLTEMEAEKHRKGLLGQQTTGSPIIVAHRINTVAGLLNVPTKYGVEVDVRHDQATDTLYLSHEPGAPTIHYDTLTEYLKHFRHRFIIFNIKEAGIEDRCIALARQFGIPKDNYFLLDVEFPYLYRASRQLGIREIAVRYSEAEPIELALAQIGLIDWVWIDTNTRLPLDRSTVERLAPLHTALVSPDRWGRSEDIASYRSKLQELGCKLDLVMCGLEYSQQWE